MSSTRPVGLLLACFVLHSPAGGLAAEAGELAGKLVILDPSHGSYWNASTQSWSRAMRTLCGPNPATNLPPDWTSSRYKPSDYYYWTAGYQWGSFYEDDATPEIIRFLAKYVESAGAEVWVSRELDKNAGDFDYARYGYPNCAFPLPKWQVATKYYLQDRGDVPSSVWGSVGHPDEIVKDMLTRAFYANYRMAQKFPGQDQLSQSVWSHCVLLCLHSNAGGTDTARGTETYWSTAAYQHLQEEGKRFAEAIHAGAIHAIREEYDGFWADAMYPAGSTAVEWPPETPYGYVGYSHGGGPTTQWQDRGVKSRPGFPELYAALMPGALCEIAFHDDWKFYPDHAFMMDEIWQATVAWGFYEGICNHFYAPARPRMAATVVSIEFPPLVKANELVSGCITVQNQGMAWCWGNKFEAATKQYLAYTVWKLKATANEQFTPGAQISLHPDAVIYPGENATFAVDLIAPSEPGVYTTEWQMVKDDARGGDFGGVATARIRVADCSELAGMGDFDCDCDVDAKDLDLFAACAGGSMVAVPANCTLFNLDGDTDVDQEDFGVFQRCYSGAGRAANPDRRG